MEELLVKIYEMDRFNCPAKMAISYGSVISIYNFFYRRDSQIGEHTE